MELQLKNSPRSKGTLDSDTLTRMKFTISAKRTPYKSRDSTKDNQNLGNHTNMLSSPNRKQQ